VGKALTIRVRREADYVLVRLDGEVDIATVTGLRERLWALAVCRIAKFYGGSPTMVIRTGLS
jgi:hypothetical protein